MNKPLLSLPLALLLLAACSDCIDPRNPDCPNYDPCFGRYPRQGAIEMLEIMGGGSFSTTPVVSDTSLVKNAVLFRSVAEADSYEWIIGLDPRRWHSREVVLRFSEPTKLLVQLRLWWQPETDCFPEDPGRDTVYRDLVVLPRSASRIFGSYKGQRSMLPHDDYPSGTHTIDFVMDTTFSWGDTLLRIVNLHPGCTNNRDFSPSLREMYGYAAASFNSGGSTDRYPDGSICRAPVGLALLSPSRREIEIVFRMHDSARAGYPPHQYLFTGTRQ